MSAHTRALWRVHYGVCTMACALWRVHYGAINPFLLVPGQLDPTNPHTMKLLGDVYSDVVAAFQQPSLFHLGGSVHTFSL